MRFISTLACLLFFVAPVLSQSPTPAQLIGTWIGESNEMDVDFVEPLPYRITFRADSTALIGVLWSNLPEREVRWSIKDRVMRFDTNTFAPGQWRVTDDRLTISGWLPLRFRKLTNIPLDSAIVRSQIAGCSWGNDSLKYNLYKDGSVCVENKKTTNRALHYWQLVRVEESLFLLVRGTHRQETGNTHFPLQIVSLTNRQLTLRGWNGQRWGDFGLIKLQDLPTGETCQPHGFQPCDYTFIYKPSRKYPYYTYNKGRLGSIRRIVAREFQPVVGVTQSGLVRFRFVVNCEGKAGLFEMTTLDENYKPYRFDPRVTDQLQRICQEKITDWEPGKGTGTDKDTVYDTVCLLTFRFKNGDITEIFP